MIHPLSNVMSSKIGCNTTIWQYSVVLDGAEIGENCNINCHTFIESKVKIGNNVTIKAGVYLWEGITIEDNVFIGPNVTFTNDKYPKSKNKAFLLEKTIIRREASIGAGSIILPGLEIGEFAMVGAGSLITKSLPPFTLWLGNKAKQAGYVTRTGIVLNMDLFDKEGVKYKLLKNGEPVTEKE